LQILDVNKLCVNFGGENLFENLNFTLNEGESLCIVGENGCGKSTLLKIIAGLIKPDGGQVSIKKDCKVAYLDQTGSSFRYQKTAQSFLRDAFQDLLTMEKDIEKVYAKLEQEKNETEHAKLLNKYCMLIEKFSSFGGYDIDTNIKIVADGLGITKDILDTNFDDLSGGEKTLVQLAHVLLQKPGLLLLDEPTNHLDVSKIEWLENFIKSFKGATLIVSHDRYFLDKLATKILCLDTENTKIYNTNYTGFLEERQKDFEKQMAEYKDVQDLIKRLEERRKFFMQKGMAYNSSTLCDRAHALQTQIERIKTNAVKKPKVSRKLKIDFEQEKKSSKSVIALKNVSVLLPSGKKVLDNISLNIFANEKVAIIGNNGSGKSTFVKTILFEQTLNVSGEVHIGPTTSIGYMPQIIHFKNGKQELLDYFKENTSLNEQQARETLAKFHFYKEDMQKRIENLSGGEKMRLKLAEILQNKINTLIFDEPTNHIDIPTKEVLEIALKDFGGTLIFVSHDRYFINNFAEKIFEFKDGKVTTFLGNYDEYRNQISKNKV